MPAGSDVQVDVDGLVRGAQAGDAASFAALYEHFFAQVHRYLSFKTGNPGEAEDLTAEVFVKMLESIHTFKWKGYPFSSWLFRIAHNLMVDYFRARDRRRHVPLDDVADGIEGSPVDVDSRLDLQLTMAEVRDAMEGLTDLQSEVISLRFAAGLSVAETARAVGKNDNAVKALQHAGLKRLRCILSETPSVLARLQRA